MITTLASPPRSVLDRPAAEKTECRRDASSRAGDAGAGTRGGVHAWLHDRLPSLPTLLSPPAEGEPGPYRLRCSCRANCLAAPGLRYQTRASHFWECVPKGITPQACTVRVSKVPRTSFVRANNRDTSHKSWYWKTMLYQGWLADLERTWCDLPACSIQVC